VVHIRRLDGNEAEQGLQCLVRCEPASKQLCNLASLLDMGRMEGVGNGTFSRAGCCGIRWK
jgi:hypothetical protein